MPNPNPNAIEVRTTEVQEQDGRYWMNLSYYMENNPDQKHWRKVPGVVVGQDKDDTLAKAEAIAAELSELDIKEMTPAIKKLIEANRMIQRLPEAES